MSCGDAVLLFFIAQNIPAGKEHVPTTLIRYLVYATSQDVKCLYFRIAVYMRTLYQQTDGSLLQYVVYIVLL